MQSDAPFENKLGSLLRRFRRDKEETQGDMASKLGISVSYLCQIEKGGRELTPTIYSKVLSEYRVTAEEKRSFEKAWRGEV